MPLRAITATALLIAACNVTAQPRSSAAKHAFQREHPCPSTGKKTGRCVGYTIDHRIALCVAGKDEPANMRWQENGKSFDKDKWECKAGWEKKLAECERRSCFVR